MQAAAKAEQDRANAVKQAQLEKTSFEAKISRIRREVIDKIMTDTCPKCHATFFDFEACFSITCTCGAYFCAWCLALSSNKDESHRHVIQCSHNLAPGRTLHAPLELFHQSRRQRIEALLVTYCKDMAQAEVDALFAALHKEFVDLNVNPLKIVEAIRHSKQPVTARPPATTVARPSFANPSFVHVPATHHQSHHRHHQHQQHHTAHMRAHMLHGVPHAAPRSHAADADSSDEEGDVFAGIPFVRANVPSLAAAMAGFGTGKPAPRDDQPEHAVPWYGRPRADVAPRPVLDSQAPRHAHDLKPGHTRITGVPRVRGVAAEADPLLMEAERPVHALGPPRPNRIDRGMAVPDDLTPEQIEQLFMHMSMK